MKLKRFIVNSITLVRIPVIVLLASASTDEPLVALGLYAVGLVSHALDGTLATRLGVKRNPEEQEVWHTMDTMVLSLGLQLSAAIWLLRADVFPWWVIPIYLVVTFGLEFIYVQPRKAAERAFLPIVLFGSWVVWLALAVLISAQDSPAVVVISISSLVILAVLHSVWHPEIHNHWVKERRGNRPSTGW